MTGTVRPQGQDKSSTSGNDRCRRGGTRKFCRWVVRRIELKPWPRSRGANGSFVPSGSTPSIARRPRLKSSLEGLKTTKWTPAAGLCRHPVALGVGAPCERVVQRVEVGPVRDRRAGPVHRAARAYRGRRQARHGLQRRRVPDLLRGDEVALHLRFARDVVRALRDGEHVLRHLQPRPENGRDPLLVGEVDVPGLEVLADVRHGEVRALDEVAARTEPQFLDVCDLLGPQPGPLGRREPQEQLGLVGDQVRAGHLGRDRHPLRETPAAVESAAREALADARHPEEVEVLEERFRGCRDVVEVVAAQKHRDVVRLEDELGRVARKAPRVEQDADRLARRLRRPSVEGDVAVGQLRRRRSESTGGPRRR